MLDSLLRTILGAATVEALETKKGRPLNTTAPDLGIEI
jgi:hypothetical protein